MLKEWIGDVVGKMHIHKISSSKLAAHIGVTPEYISMVLNGHREPTGIEERLRQAIDEIANSNS